MKKILECPYCDGIAGLVKKDSEFPYRKEVYKVVEHYYKCDKCREEFTTTQTDTITVLQAHNQYRERYKTPFPEDISAIREKYEISGTKMSEVLGLGVNGFSNYERGEMPTQAIGNLINTISDPKVFKDMLGRARGCFTDGMYENAIKKVHFLIEQKKSVSPFYNKLNLFLEPTRLTGFKKPNIDKLANLLVEFIARCDKSFNDRLKLNKLLFYTDFLCYKQFGCSITGLSYRTIQYGPVPTCYDNIYSYLEDENIISPRWIRESDGSARETFITDSTFDGKLFNDDEKSIIDTICDNFGEMKTWDMVDLSHKEKAWIDLQSDKQVIDYQKYAFDLKAI